MLLMEAYYTFAASERGMKLSGERPERQKII